MCPFHGAESSGQRYDISQQIEGNIDGFSKFNSINTMNWNGSVLSLLLGLFLNGMNNEKIMRMNAFEFRLDLLYHMLNNQKVDE